MYNKTVLNQYTYFSVLDAYSNKHHVARSCPCSWFRRYSFRWISRGSCVSTCLMRTVQFMLHGMVVKLKCYQLYPSWINFNWDTHVNYRDVSSRCHGLLLKIVSIPISFPLISPWIVNVFFGIRLCFWVLFRRSHVHFHWFWCKK